MKKKVILWAIPVCVLIAILVFIFVAKSIPKPDTEVDSVEKVMMPNLKHSTLEDAKEKLNSLGIEFSVIDEYDLAEAGLIVSQDIVLGQMIDKGTEVKLTVSKGPEPVIVPNLVNMGLEEASEILLQLGLNLKSTVELNDTVPSNSVLSQNIEPNQIIKKGSEIVVVISVKSNTVGNTSGNLCSDGYAAEQGEWIYLSGSKSLIKINKETGQNIEVCKFEHNIYNINVVGDWIYYYSFADGIYKIRTDGTNEQEIVGLSDDCNLLFVEEGYIYYGLSLYEEDQLYKMNIAENRTEKILAENVMGYIITENYIYYSMFEGGALFRTNKDGQDKTSIPLDFLRGMDIKEDIVYYLNQYSQLYKTDINNVSAKTLLSEDISNFNVSGDWIYYLQKTKTTKYDLCKMKTDGTEKMVLTSAEYASINVVGDWIIVLGDGVKYRIKTDGTVNEIIRFD